MVAAALAAVLVTLWLTGAIGFLPSPFETSTTLATTVATPTTTVVETTTSADSPNTTTTPTAVTTTEPLADFELVFDDPFSSNINGWAEGDFSDANANYFFGFLDGAYQAGYSAIAPDLTYYSIVLFNPDSDLFDLETEVTSLLSGSQCGLALQGASGSLLAVAIGDGQVIARLYNDGVLANTGFWEVEALDPNETRFALSVDGTDVTIHIDDEEVDTFEEPFIEGVQQIGVAVMGGFDTYCSYDYLEVWAG